MQPENLNENRVLNLTVPEQFAGMRLDQCLANCIRSPREAVSSP